MTEFLLTIYNFNQTGDENKEKYQFKDFLVDPIPNSQN